MSKEQNSQEMDNLLTNSDDTTAAKKMALIPVKSMNLFPGMILHFDLNDERSLKALENCMQTNQLAFLCEQKDINSDALNREDLYSVGCIAKIKQVLKLPNDFTRILVEIIQRGVIDRWFQDEPYFIVGVIPRESVFSNTPECQTLLKLVEETFVNYIHLTKNTSGNIQDTLDLMDDPDHLIDLICTNISLSHEKAQEILQEFDGDHRLILVYQEMVKELSAYKIKQSINEKVRSEIEKNQREYVLREEIKVLQNELNQATGEESLIGKYKKKIAEKDLNSVVKQKAENELQRLSKLQPGSPEAGVIQDYLDWILSLPWNESTVESIDVNRVQKILNRDHYALEKVKERILEYISVLQLSNSLKAPILCLVGPPGVGKTSIARSIAEALNRKYVRMSLGGLSDEAEIRGHRRTYIGAIPGRIIYHIQQAGTNNPLFLLDEIDKISQNFRGDPASALLEVLDPEQNNTFTDNYLELPFDLSHVLFIATANSLSTIPRPLLDRMEIIEVNGYIEEEKEVIAKKYLVPKQIKENGLSNENIHISEGAIKDIISYYTRESGVRELEREIAKVCRVAAKNVVSGSKTKNLVNVRNLEKYLGRRKFLFEKVQKGKVVGLVNGLAWTAVGGVTLEIEALAVKGSGKTFITGKLGDVMQESIKAAIGYIRSIADQLEIDPDFISNKDIHVHVPEGAVPKDGPSAGITMATALISALTGRPVSQDIAMTGEITLLGRVLPIGGLREKLTAASRASIKRVIIPKENEKDLEDIPESVLSQLEIHPVKRMTEVIQLVFGKINENK
ncbi:endopeptidase La [Pseudoramibacter sp.]|jgi:ATP-dependent Lon protease|uniref:endopeptidase La n=1 Tax=Pseudoramibacter sp. TaxID=2034862 RepID=UPI0025DC669D|nr:endopeptidase La [Pseudoramibacter sp.]MCH4072762.1 endopeptidase La [Pseudoramibacter sp.]MCH4106533.1 endopeptidase La [Pseudoramibacter sp.]